MRGKGTWLPAVVLVLLSGTALAQPQAAATVPPVMRISGTVPGAAGAWPVTFGLYAEQSGGAALWSETQSIAFDQAGRYSVVLGQATPEGLPIQLFADSTARWLDVSVEGMPPQPRILLASVAYALKAADASTVGGKPLSAFILAGETTGVGPDGLTYVDKRVLDKALSGSFAQPAAGNPGYIPVFTGATEIGDSVMYQAGTSIGVGTTAPAAPFNVAGTVAPAAFFDVYSNALSALPAVYRAARGTPLLPSAVQTDDILGGLAVRGFGSTQFGPGVGQVMFKAAQPFTDTARGTYLMMTTTPVNSSIWLERLRIDSAGNVGIGTSVPTARLDVAGTAWFSPGTADIGLGMTTAGASGISVQNTNAEGVGVFSWADPADAFAVLATSDNGVAIGGMSTPAGWAGYFVGDIHADWIDKGGGSFRIDHPLDPEHKYLSHSFVESPDMKNIYDGVAVLDANGEATVTMPDWFEALNQDFRYQLTPIGAAFVPYVAEEIAGNQFRIAGGLPGRKVSWQVTGVRHDAFANANRLQVEELKPDDEAGTYLHPEAFGQPRRGSEAKKGGKTIKDVKAGFRPMGKANRDPGK